jgi:hypothetical protein
MLSTMKLTCAALIAARFLGAQAAVSQQELESWEALWQRKLQLQDWNIGITIVPQKELGSSVGSVSITWPRRATIRVLDARQSITYVPRTSARLFTELTVVHELVHVTFAPLPLSGRDERGIDRVVEDIAEAILFGRAPACVTPQTFMAVEISSLPGMPIEPRIKDMIARQLTTGFLDGRPAWNERHDAACAARIKAFFARSGWR